MEVTNLISVVTCIDFRLEVKNRKSSLLGDILLMISVSVSYRSL